MSSSLKIRLLLEKVVFLHDVDFLLVGHFFELEALVLFVFRRQRSFFLGNWLVDTLGPRPLLLLLDGERWELEGLIFIRVDFGVEVLAVAVLELVFDLALHVAVLLLAFVGVEL